MKKTNLTELFIEMANPDHNGFSREVFKIEFVGKYQDLHFTNGCNWMRSLRGKFLYETSGRGESWKIKLIGVDNGYHNRSVRPDILVKIIKQKCVHTGFDGTTQNGIECDHKNGRYDDLSVLKLVTQKIDDFQPLTRQSNLFKRSCCQLCKLTDKRFDAKTLGYSVSYIEGGCDYLGTCVGCYWYDVQKFKNNLIKINETTNI